MKALSPAVRIFQELTSVPTAPFYEQAVAGKALAWLKRALGSRVRIDKRRGGIIVRYLGAGKGPALCLAAHIDHPGFHVKGGTAKLQGGLNKDYLPGAAIEAFAKDPKDNTPAARGILGTPKDDLYPVSWTQAPKGARPAFASLALTPFSIEGGWLCSRSIDDLLGAAVSLETLRVVARGRMKTNLTVILHRAEEVGFIGALDIIKDRAIDPGDSVLSIETSKELPDAVPGKGPVIRVGDRMSLFDPNLLALLDGAGEAVKCQRTRLTGGSCEATAYLAFGYETAGVSVPLVNYHNGGQGKVEPEKVRLSDVDGSVRLLVSAARRFPEAVLRGKTRARLSARHEGSSKGLRL